MTVEFVYNKHNEISVDENVMNTLFSMKLEVNILLMPAASLISFCSSSCPICHLALPIGLLPEGKVCPGLVRYY